jgi:serine/threonine protein kinase
LPDREQTTALPSTADPSAATPLLSEVPALTTPPTKVAPSVPAQKIKGLRRIVRDQPELPPDAPTALGGYQVLKQLGQGGMGTVYLARQLSLDRNVALKTMNPQWAESPLFLARFTREAYAAAQLVHHNVVQIYDIGEDKGIPFFSMEFVPGTNLAHLVAEKGRLDVEEAVGYVLQAARGLKYAHDQGMVHRDVKPDNLMLNDQGIIKVADLGLVKTPAAADDETGYEAGAQKACEAVDATAVGVAMGTPSYMAPEQGTNAAGVDHRADVYSLGCTLYVLLTGRPPFEGKTAMEVITKHRSEPIVRPEVLVSRVPREVSEILLKMLAKKPEHRFADLSEVIHALEQFLGVQSSGAFTPREEHANALEASVKEFNGAPAAQIRSGAAPVFFAVCGVLFLLTLILGWGKLAACALGLGLFTGLFSFLLSGFTNKSHLFLTFRELVFDSRWTDWLAWTTGILLAGGLLYVFGLLWMWVVVLIFSLALAAVYHVLIDRNPGRAEAGTSGEGGAPLQIDAPQGPGGGGTAAIRVQIRRL